jgi:hypothetical protein
MEVSPFDCGWLIDDGMNDAIMRRRATMSKQN